MSYIHRLENFCPLTELPSYASAIMWCSPFSKANKVSSTSQGLCCCFFWCSSLSTTFYSIDTWTYDMAGNIDWCASIQVASMSPVFCYVQAEAMKASRLSSTKALEKSGATTSSTLAWDISMTQPSLLPPENIQSSSRLHKRSLFPLHSHSIYKLGKKFCLCLPTSTTSPSASDTSISLSSFTS